MRADVGDVADAARARARRATAPILLGLVAVLCLSSCSLLPWNRPVPAQSTHSLVGAWTADKGRASLRLGADAQFTLSDAPVGVLQNGEVDGSGQLLGPAVSTTGSWALGDVDGNENDPDGNPLVTLTFQQNPWARTLTLAVVKYNGSLALEERYGDPDHWQHYEFGRDEAVMEKP